MATKPPADNTAATTPVASASVNPNPTLLHESLYQGYAVAPITKAELRTILEHFAAGVGTSSPA
jgi:hypothetical protein